jgi:hypothetical protein
MAPLVAVAVKNQNSKKRKKFQRTHVANEDVTRDICNVASMDQELIAADLFQSEMKSFVANDKRVGLRDASIDGAE